MSIKDPIELCVRSQVIFKLIDVFFNVSCDFFSVSDEKNVILFESVSFKSSKLRPFYVISQPLSLARLNFNHCYNFDVTLFSSDDLFFYVPYKTRYVSFCEKSKKYVLTIYEKLTNYPFDYFLLDKNVFIYSDKLGCTLDVIHVINYLKHKNVIEILNEDEWMIIWLLARGFSSKKLSIVFGSNKNAIDQSIKRILYKHKIYNRDLLIKVIQILGWDLFIPKKLFDLNYG